MSTVLVSGSVVGRLTGEWLGVFSNGVEVKEVWLVSRISKLERLDDGLVCASDDEVTLWVAFAKLLTVIGSWFVVLLAKRP